MKLLCNVWPTYTADDWCVDRLCVHTCSVSVCMTASQSNPVTCNIRSRRVIIYLQKFLAYILQSSLLFDIIVPALYEMLGAKTAPSKYVSLLLRNTHLSFWQIKLGCYMLVSLSFWLWVEREISVRCCVVIPRKPCLWCLTGFYISIHLLAITKAHRLQLSYYLVGTTKE